MSTRVGHGKIDFSNTLLGLAYAALAAGHWSYTKRMPVVPYLARVCGRYSS